METKQDQWWSRSGSNRRPLECDGRGRPVKDFDYLFSLYEQQQQIDGCSPAGLYAARRLKSSFTGFSIEEITALRINEHILRRRKSGAANATINRELAALGRMFQLAHRFETLASNQARRWA